MPAVLYNSKRLALTLACLLVVLTLPGSTAHGQFGANSTGQSSGGAICTDNSLGASSASSSCAGTVGGYSATAKSSAAGLSFDNASSISGSGTSYYANGEAFSTFQDNLLFSGAATPSQLIFYFSLASSLSGGDVYNESTFLFDYAGQGAEAQDWESSGAAHQFLVNTTALGGGVFRTAFAYSGNGIFGAEDIALTALPSDGLSYVSGYGSTTSHVQILGIDAVDDQGNSLAGSIDCMFEDSGQACNLGQIDGVSATPEPASLVLLGTGLVGVFGVARRKRSVNAA